MKLTIYKVTWEVRGHLPEEQLTSTSQGALKFKDELTSSAFALRAVFAKEPKTEKVEIDE